MSHDMTMRHCGVCEGVVGQWICMLKMRFAVVSRCQDLSKVTTSLCHSVGGVGWEERKRLSTFLCDFVYGEKFK